MAKFLLAAATLLGTIVGAGVFALPYVFVKSGVAVCFFYFLLLGFVVIMLHLFFAQAILSAKKETRLVGLAERYLGKKAKALVASAIIAGVAGSLLVYIILSGDFLALVLPGAFSPFQYAILAWLLFTFLVFLGTHSIALVEFLMGIILFAVVGLILIFSLPYFQTSNLVLFNSQNIFLPFGIIFFSLVGWSALPAVEDILKNKKDIKKLIISVLLFCCLFYFLFGLIISGVSGVKTTGQPFSGIAPFLGDEAMILGGIFGFLVVATSFITLANYLKNTFIFDFKAPRILALLLVCGLPLILFLAGLRDFISVVSIVGAFVGAVEGTAIVLIFQKSRKAGDRTPEFSLEVPKIILFFVVFVLLSGALFQLIYR